MGRTWLILVAATTLLFPAASIPQNTITTEQQVQRVAPPPPGASAADLEKSGDELRADKAYVDALDYYAAALKKQPSAVIYNKAGICELQMMHFGPAKKYFQQAVKLDAKYAEAHNNLGVTFYEQKKTKQAVKEYLKAVKLDDDSAAFHANLGTAYLSRKEFDKMSAEYSRALQLDPLVFEHSSLTGVSLRLGTPEDRARYDFLVAKVYASLGNSEESLRYLRKAMEEGYKQIGEVYKDNEFAVLRKDPRFTELMAQKPPAIP